MGFVQIDWSQTTTHNIASFLDYIVSMLCLNECKKNPKQSEHAVLPNIYPYSQCSFVSCCKVLSNFSHSYEIAPLPVKQLWRISVNEWHHSTANTWYNHNMTNHNKTVAMYYGMYCVFYNSFSPTPRWGGNKTYSHILQHPNQTWQAYNEAHTPFGHGYI